MNLLFVADVRSPIAISWISLFVEAGHEVSVISTYEAMDTASLPYPVRTAPIADFRSPAGRRPDATNVVRSQSDHLKQLIRGNRFALKVSAHLRSLIAPAQVRLRAPELRRFVRELRPDIVHALRIPYEGYLASEFVPDDIPLVVSIWGNDLTLQANLNPVKRRLTGDTLRRTEGLLADCARDVRLAPSYGFDSDRPSAVVPGGGGINPSFKRVVGPELVAFRRGLGIPDDADFVLNPRGLRAYINAEAFVDAGIEALKSRSNLVVGYLAVAGCEWIAERVRDAGVSDRFLLLPAFPHEQMALLYSSASVVVSPSYHDGTPNTLLESMACECVPIAGEIESVKEWIIQGENGLLVDPGDVPGTVRAITRALSDSRFRSNAIAKNLALIAERADRKATLKQTMRLYECVLEQRGGVS